MATIKKLSDALIDQIAAGEVVDRPASAVKELTENAIDAGAEKIEIRLVDGGIQSIWVKDNGKGMAREDLLACTDRHATSKVQSFDDLYSLATMGFRGEALASIAAVSRFTVRSRLKGAEQGHQLELVDGQKTLTDWSGSAGTAVSVAELFASVPARRKFLKKPAAEYLACLETLTALALAHPEVAMTLHHQDKLVFSYPSSSLQERVEQVWQSKLQGKTLLALKGRHNLVDVSGFISPPGLERGTGKDIFTFVNGRYIKDQKLRYAVLRGYHSHLLKGRFPMVVLQLTIDPAIVDVNVSPAKTEIRLQYSDEITAFISATIKEKIREGLWAKQSFDEPLPTDSATPEPVRLTDDFSVPVEAVRAGAHHSAAPAEPAASPRGLRGPSSGGYRAQPLGLGRQPAAEQTADQPMRQAGGDYDDLSSLLGPNVTVNSRSMAASRPPAAPEPAQPAGGASSDELAVDGQFQFDQLRFVGTFFECYLAYEHGSRLLFIDQHAFHERILFEKLCRRHEAMLAPQPLLIPEGCQLNEAAVQDIANAKDTLAAMGIEVVRQGDTCIEVVALPALLHRSDPLRVLEDVAAILARYDNLEDSPARKESTLAEELADTLYHDLYATIACHSAIRSGETLAEQDRLMLEQEAAGVDFYLNCPHGRRVFKWLSQREVAGWFDRT